MAFLSLNLLLSQLLHVLRELNNSLFFFSDLLLQAVRLALEHVDFRAVLLSLTDGGNGSGLLFVDHSAQLSCFSLASFFLFFIKLLKLLILAVFVHHCVLEPVVFVLKSGYLSLELVKFGLLVHLVNFELLDSLPELVTLRLNTLLDFLKIKLSALETHMVLLLQPRLLLELVFARDDFIFDLAQLARQVQDLFFKLGLHLGAFLT